MPAGATYNCIATTTLSSAQSSVTFSSISGSYTDLVLVINGTSNVDTNPTIRFNSDSGSNYSDTALLGNGSTASSNRRSNVTVAYVGIIYSASISTNIVHIMNYSNTTTNKTVLSRGNNAGNRVDARVTLWRNTAAITTIEITADGNNFSSGCTFSLYGIAAA